MNNAFGLDADYFIRLFARELNPDVVRNQTPECLARVLARAARTACAEVLAEPEFQQPVADEQAEPATAQEEQQPIEGNMKLPCEVRLPGGMTIGKGCALSTLLLALRNRDDSMPWRQRFGVPMPFDPRLHNLIAALSAQGGGR